MVKQTRTFSKTLSIGLALDHRPNECPMWFVGGGTPDSSKLFGTTRPEAVGLAGTTNSSVMDRTLRVVVQREVEKPGS